MYPRQRPSGLSDEETKQWIKTKVDWYKNNKPVESWPWSVLRLFQQENGISQSGARDLQNQRVNAFLKESFVSVREIAQNTEIPPFTRYPFNLRFKRIMEDECSILHIHKDVLKSFIIGRLVDDPRSLFSLMLTCKDLQGLCQEMLCRVAQERFGPRGTPRALMMTTNFESNTNIVSKKRKISQDLKRMCGVTGRDFKASEDTNADNVDDIIRVSIKKYGLIDNLEKVRENEAKKEAYLQLERAYILGQVEGRIQQVNQRFVNFGYQGLSVRFDNNTCAWTDLRITLVLMAFEYGNEYHASRVLKEVVDWVFMKTDSKVGRPSVDPDLFNIALSAMDANVTTIHPLTHIVLESLMEIKHREYYLYGRKISEDDWKTRLANLFSPLFLERNPPPIGVSGAWLCCWMHENTHVKLVRLFESPQYRISNYCEGMRNFEDRYRIRMGLPATGLGYASHVPMYILKGPVKISFAHALLIKMT